MISVDLLVTGLILFCALAFLGWRMLPGRSVPACHQSLGARAEGQVQVGASLARGVKAARARQRRARRR